MSLFKDGSKIISGLGRIASSPAKGSTWKKNLSPEEKSFLNTHPASNFEAEYQFKQRYEKYKKKQSKKNVSCLMVKLVFQISIQENHNKVSKQGAVRSRKIQFEGVMIQYD